MTTSTASTPEVSVVGETGTGLRTDGHCEGLGQVRLERVVFDRIDRTLGRSA